MQEDIWQAMQKQVDQFVDQDPGRSVYLQVLGPEKREYGRQADLMRPGASVLKLAIAGAFWQKVQKGRLSPQQTVSADRVDHTQYASPVAAFKEAGEPLPLQLLAILSLTTSDNSATTLLLEELGRETVERWARAAGATSTTIKTGFGDHQLALTEQASKNLTTAQDSLSMLSAYREQDYLQVGRKALENNVYGGRLRRYLPDELTVLHKTGSLEGCYHDVGIIQMPTIQWGLSVLTSNQPNRYAAEKAIGELAHHLYWFARQL